MRQIHKTVKQYYPKLFERISELTDHRKRRDYQVAELITGVLVLFLLKEASRNALNSDRSDERFANNYFKIFKRRLPHMDTANTFLEQLPADELEQLKAALVSGLIEQKVLCRFKLLGKYYTIAIDGTGTNSYKENDAEQSRVSKTSKNDTVTYYHYVVEAKLVTSSGLSLSLASEWVANEAGRNYDKQDCEQRAFERLAKKLKRYFPRLPVCILADGLYPNKTFMKICTDNKWAYIVVLKDDSLKTLQEDIKDVENKTRHTLESDNKLSKGKKHIHQKYDWITEELTYSGYTVYWLSCTETVTHSGKDNEAIKSKITRFVYLTSLPVDKTNARILAQGARMRWNIEDGFNTQKHRGYNLGHKFNRKSFTAYKNYYQCMQIAHTINQLVEHSDTIVALHKADAKLQYLTKTVIRVISNKICSRLLR